MDLKLHICLAAIIRWEQLTDRSFATCDYSNEEDLLRLIYCAAEDSIAGKHPFDRFVRVVRDNPSVLAAAIREMQEQNAFTAQFQRATKASIDTPAKKEDNAERLGTIAAQLIVQGGMPPHYVLQEMPLQDLSLYAEALSDRFKQEQESARLWTFIQIQPHIEKGKYKTPKDIYRFPWEERAIAARAESEVKHLRETVAEFNGRLRNAQWKTAKK